MSKLTGDVVAVIDSARTHSAVFWGYSLGARVGCVLGGPIPTRLRNLSNMPRPPGVFKLAGAGDFRIRVGDYRVVYAVDDRNRVIVGRIAHRREVFRQWVGQG